MTKRENYLRSLKREENEFLTWAPNFDWWLGHHKRERTLPGKYKDMSRNDMVRELDGSIWARASTYQTFFDGIKVVRCFVSKSLIDSG